MTGKTLSGKYEIKREVGRGGMGIIYEALHTALNRTVAIKVLHTQFTKDIGFLDRFKREARAMARLDHKNIIRVFDVLEDEGTHFIIMEYFKGRNLCEILSKKKTLPQRSVLSIAYQIAKGLSYAHEKGVIHRDIKPANIIISKNGTAKIADFGIAATTDEISLTAANHIIGTPEYMSLEQSRGESLDGRSDLYSLGMVMYEMLNGQSCYAGIAGVEVLKKLAYDESEFELRFEPHIVPSLQTLVTNLLKKNKTHRIADTSVLIQQIKTSKLELKIEKNKTTKKETRVKEQEAITSKPQQKRPLPKPHSEHTNQTPPPFFLTRKKTGKEGEEDNTQATVVTPKQTQRPIVQAPPSDKKWPKRIAAIAVSMLIFSGIAATFLNKNPQHLKRQTAKPQLARQIRPSTKKPQNKTTGLEKKALARVKKEKTRIEKERQARKKTTTKRAKLRKKIEQKKKKRKKQDALLRGGLIKLSKEKHRTKKEASPLKKVPRKRKTRIKTTNTKNKTLPKKQTAPTQIARISPANTIDSLGAILSRLTTAYEKKDLRTLQKMTRMSKNRRIFLEQVFKNYKTVSVSVTDLSIEEKRAEAIISITELRTHKDKRTHPPEQWKNARLIIPKKKGQWDKAIW